MHKSVEEVKMLQYKGSQSRPIKRDSRLPCMVEIRIDTESLGTKNSGPPSDNPTTSVVEGVSAMFLVLTLCFEDNKQLLKH